MMIHFLSHSRASFSLFFGISTFSFTSPTPCTAEMICFLRMWALFLLCGISMAEIYNEMHPYRLLRKDLEKLNCLFFRRDCMDHLTDLAEANRIFWKIMTPAKPAEQQLNTVKLELYMESQCPDTTRFVQKQLVPAWNMLGSTGRIDLTIVPFGKARCIQNGDDFDCSCQHGSDECELNQLMNCAIERLGFPDKIVPVIACIQGKRSFDGAMKECIEPLQNVNPDQIRSCAKGPRGRRLLALAGSRTAGLKPSLSFVPWIVINEERNADALYDLSENLCRALEPAPAACSVYEKSE